MKNYAFVVAGLLSLTLLMFSVGDETLGSVLAVSPFKATGIALGSGGWAMFKIIKTDIYQSAFERGKLTRPRLNRLDGYCERNLT